MKKLNKLNSPSQKAYSEIKKICESNQTDNDKSAKIRNKFSHMKTVNLSLEKNNPVFKKLVRYDINGIGENLLNDTDINLPGDIRIAFIIPGDLSE